VVALHKQLNDSAYRRASPGFGDLEASTDEPFVATALVRKEVGRSDQPLEFFASAVVFGRVEEDRSRG